MTMKKTSLLSDRELNTIRGKALVGAATTHEVLSVFAHLDLLEMWLDEIDQDDNFGTEGWRHAAGIPEDHP